MKAHSGAKTPLHTQSATDGAVVAIVRKLASEKVIIPQEPIGDAIARFNALIVEARRAVATVELSMGEPEPTSLDHPLASAIYDSENTARLQEHPEELDAYLARARDLRAHMKTLGLAIVSDAPVAWRYTVRTQGALGRMAERVRVTADPEAAASLRRDGVDTQPLAALLPDPVAMGGPLDVEAIEAVCTHALHSIRNWPASALYLAADRDRDRARVQAVRAAALRTTTASAVGTKAEGRSAPNQDGKEGE